MAATPAKITDLTEGWPVATTARGDDPNLRSAFEVDGTAIENGCGPSPPSRKARSLVAITPGQSNPGVAPMARKTL